MADNYELEYKKIHNTLKKDAPANNYGFRIGQRVGNLLEPIVNRAKDLRGSFNYASYVDTIWRDDLDTTKILSYDLLTSANLVDDNKYPGPDDYHTSELFSVNPPLVHEDFFTPLYTIGASQTKYYYENYRPGWYRGINGALYCPNTIDLTYYTGSIVNTAEKHDFRSVFIGSPYQNEILGISGAPNTLISHKIYLKQNSHYIFQIVNRYNKWPDRCHIFIQYLIENECYSYSSASIIKYCQPAFEPINIGTVDPSKAYCFYTPNLTDRQYFLPSAVKRAGKQLRLRDVKTPRLYAVIYITNTNVGSNEWTMTDSEGEKYNLSDYSFFLFESNRSFMISENGTILSYQTLDTQTFSGATYGESSVVRTVFNDVRPALNRTRPILEPHTTGADTNDPYIGVRFSPQLTVNNIQDFKRYFSEFKDIYYDNSGSVVSVWADWTAVDLYSLTRSGTYKTISESDFSKALSEQGYIFKQTLDPEEPFVCGWSEGRTYSSSDLSASEIVQLLNSEGQEIVLVPYRDVVQTSVARDREWKYSKYRTTLSQVPLRLIDSSNPKGENKDYFGLTKNFKKEVNLYYAPNADLSTYWIDENQVKHYTTGWRITSEYQPWLRRTGARTTSVQVESSQTVYPPYVHMGAYRFKVFYENQSGNDLDDDDLMIKFYLRPASGQLAFRPELKSQVYPYNPYSGTKNPSGVTWYSKKLNSITWYTLNFAKTVSATGPVSLSASVIGHDAATSNFSIEKNFYKAKGTRQRHKPASLAYSYYAYEVKHRYSHGYLKDYERSFLPWVARLRRAFFGYLHNDDDIFEKVFVGVRFKWALVDKAAAARLHDIDSRVVEDDVETYIRVYGDRFGMWGRDWAVGYISRVNYTFPLSNLLLVSQFVGKYPDQNNTYTSGQLTYQNTNVTYPVLGRLYDKTLHHHTAKGLTKTIDIAPFCWGSGKVTTLSNADETESYLAVVDTFERDILDE